MPGLATDMRVDHYFSDTTDDRGLIFAPFEGPALDESETAALKAFFASPLAGIGDRVELAVMTHPFAGTETTLVVVWTGDVQLLVDNVEFLRKVVVAFIEQRAARM